jgi:nucleotide-binding universal stress UspA family protein
MAFIALTAGKCIAQVMEALPTASISTQKELRRAASSKARRGMASTSSAASPARDIEADRRRCFMKTLEAGKRIALKNVLFATDFSPHSDMALRYALAVASQYGAKVYGAHVVSSEDYLFTAPDLWPAHVQQEKQLQQEVEGRLEEQLRGVPHEVLFGVGNVSKVLSRLIGEHAIDLLVVGTHGRTAARKLLMGSVAETMFRQAACPVLTVGPNVPSEKNGERQFQRILFATDFGKESLAALPYAVSLAEEDQAQLALLHVVEQPPAGISDLEGVTASLVRRLKELATPEAESWCHVECLVRFGRQLVSPAERILEVAGEWTADLIVLGVRPPHGALSTVTHLAHTTAQHIVAHATCPVLTVRG